MDAEKAFDNLLKRALEMKKETLCIILIILFGFFLRLIIGFNVPVSADNMVHALHAKKGS